MTNKELILASGSPRRQEILADLQLAFQVRTSDVDETLPPGIQPDEAVKYLALKKAQAVASTCSSALVIGADTIVVLDGQILGKPADAADAIRMLSRLQGRVHQVYTGIALIEVEEGHIIREITRARKTDVWMRELSREKMEWYVRTGEPLDKAGAYGIQGYGAILIDRIDGCYFNVVGMSISLLEQMMEELGYSMFDDFSKSRK
ncbi:Maf family protein [Thermoflavimicrobium dichotomicum]|uniref:dTTP/UTP pyrophosphatase n=1 Tax=Thermoflavimicrobium dichotomicum TaxID=46223 RepID=A0A1I3R8C7_9BACL|nr:Maf family protein [Thermoflavimicrobium dichotomicum]SFJ41909.1 septum formation protein [Thermoflavimicrobium dichotomicum]